MNINNVFDRQTPLSRFVGERCDAIASRKSQRQIAHEAGWKSLNIVSMIRNGDATLPLDKVAPLAKALEVEPAVLFRLAVAQFLGDNAQELVTEVFGDGVSLNPNEIEALRLLRQISSRTDPDLGNFVSSLRKQLYNLNAARSRGEDDPELKVSLTKKKAAEAAE